jgi:uncharacterized delta-60 repeat protein
MVVRCRVAVLSILVMSTACSSSGSSGDANGAPPGSGDANGAPPGSAPDAGDQAPSPTLGDGTVITLDGVKEVRSVVCGPTGILLSESSGGVGPSNASVDRILRTDLGGHLDTSFGAKDTKIATGPHAGMLLTDGSLSPRSDGSALFFGYAREANASDWSWLASAHYTSQGLDDSFGSGGVALVSERVGHVLAVAADDSFVIGRTLGFGYHVAYFSASGALTSEFDVTLPGFFSPDRMLIQKDGSLLFSGPAEQGINPNWQFVRLSKGAVDTSFGGGIVTLPNELTDIALTDDGKILLALGGDLVRLSSDGTVDTSFGTAGKVSWTPSFAGAGLAVAGDRVFTSSLLSVMPDGRISVVGQAEVKSPSAQTPYPTVGLSRLSKDGALDVSFGTNGLERPFPDQVEGPKLNSLCTLPSGLVVVGGGRAVSSGDHLAGILFGFTR